jgi:molecular chaperone GrpE
MIKRHSDGDEEFGAGTGEQPEQQSHQAGENAGTAAEKELVNLKLQLEEKDKEIGELKDKYLRTLAEADNTRKRIRQQGEESIRHQREGFLRDLLPIVDNLERAVGAAHGGGNGKSIVEGVEMVLGSLLDFLRIQGVTRVDTVGQPFDPRLHEAVDHRASAEHQPNTVVEEYHRGYVTGDRVLRPARVAVSKAHEPGSTGGTNGDQS